MGRRIHDDRLMSLRLPLPLGYTYRTDCPLSTFPPSSHSMLKVGQRLASEFHQIFGHGGGSNHIRDRGAEAETSSTAIVIPQVQIQTREELDLDDDDEEEEELNLTSPFNDQFLHQPPNDAASPTSTPRLSPTLSLSSLSANSSTESFAQYASASSSSLIPDPYHTSPHVSQTESDELAALRAASARCAYHLPPQPRFRDLNKKRVSRSSEEMRWSGVEGRRQAQRRSGSIDAVDFAHLLAQKKWGVQDRRASGSTQASERPLRSVRSFITSSSSRPATPPPPPLPQLPTHILTQKALSSGLGLDFAEPAIVQRQPSPPPTPRNLQPRRISSSGSIIGF
ncbi:hypothetical protein M407DRAFT_205193 [Tulasnella calospora MUT 4182]|uniref:Uncharacterized protein n=1 Tax=Tulasnella calospora MUT 4182 TaxID=1051891 RepID=A0A0C3QKT8_9AGAM|nr:hypothetical protein M407DRAFT_205193 [Tulasnella calospora MUT 4182]